MFWKLLLSLAALYSHSGDKGPPRESPVDVPQRLTTPYEHGPHDPEEIAAAQKALEGDIFGGDMLLPDHFNQSGDGIRYVQYRWPGYPGSARVPYVIDEALEGIRPLIEGAIQAFHDHTCIQFVERTDEEDYVRIVQGNGCSSWIGRRGGEQELSLGQGCHWHGTVIHELGHAIGLFHEHQRSDRDYYIDVYEENVSEEKLSQFEVINPEQELIFTVYDYDSIMHYGNYAFSKEPNQLMTMAAKDGLRLLAPFHKPGFTNNDITQIWNLYQCDFNL